VAAAAGAAIVAAVAITTLAPRPPEQAAIPRNTDE